MESKFRTSKKDDADLFFVPAYVKCVRMLGGLNDKEINQTYVKVKTKPKSLIQCVDAYVFCLQLQWYVWLIH